MGIVEQSVQTSGRSRSRLASVIGSIRIVDGAFNKHFQIGSSDRITRSTNERTVAFRSKIR